MIKFSQEECRNLGFARTREWLLTNGIGGYASSSILGMNTRRYHGLLVAATRPPLGRMVLLSHMDEILTVNGEKFELATHLYDSGIVHPAGYSHLRSFEFVCGPRFIWKGEGWELSKSLSIVPGQNTIVLDYALSGTERALSLELRPLLAFRDFHSTTHENGSLDQTLERRDGIVSIAPYAGLPRLYFAHGSAEVAESGYWYRRFEYELERERGLDYFEDLFNPFTLRLDIAPESAFTLIISADAQPNFGVKPKHGCVQKGSETAIPESSLVAMLSSAARQFTVVRPPFKTTIAGYHWFGDWGRDTMIALPGLLLATDQPDVAREILLQFIRLADKGMLPNRFPDDGDEPEYNTVDATLWLFEAIRQYISNGNDKSWKADAWAYIKAELYEPLKEIIRFHVQGTRYGIRADDKGFLWAGDSGTQLTWMDAKVGGLPITPRHGRPVEIQALWYNALRIMNDFAKQLGDKQAAKTYSRIANSLLANFEEVFWNPERECLFDVAGDGGNDGSVRPNQIFASSLHYPLLSAKRAAEVIQKVEAELLTPFGLRTLSRSDPHYKGTYEGDVASRDGAYHQGTVWPWLAGPFFRAKLSVNGEGETTLQQIRNWLSAFEGHLREAGIAQVSEIFDGDSPHRARGCIAQAWSVAEILRLAKLVAPS